ncbi:hypothetical protein [Terrabacter sp. RAF57]
MDVSAAETGVEQKQQDDEDGRDGEAVRKVAAVDQLPDCTKC